jgi:peptidyl-prolyl cis-trans isomerase B (cyclophilin B)
MSVLFTALACTAMATTAQAEPVQVVVETSSGIIVLELNPAAAPRTVENFLRYVADRYYDGTVFHRVIRGFMIQGGGMKSDLTPKPGRSQIVNEADNSLENKRGAVAMARTSEPHSATSQFFINTVDNDFLDHRSKDAQGWGYCVFGKVVEGMDVVDAIERTPTKTRGFHRDVPVPAVVVRRVFVKQQDPPKAP